MLFGSSCFATPFGPTMRIAPIIVRYFSKSLSNILGKYLTTIVITPYFYNFSIYYFTIFPYIILHFFSILFYNFSNTKICYLFYLEHFEKQYFFRKIGMFSCHIDCFIILVHFHFLFFEYVCFK